MEHLSHRRFLKISAATFGAAAAATHLDSLAPLAAASDAPPGDVKTVATFCEMCFWRCSGFAHVRDAALQ
jgi:thiosulfate reductase / polysulfide reductase chain A